MEIAQINLNLEDEGLFAEIEVDDYFDGIVDEVTKKANEEFMEKEVKGKILSHFKPCECQMPKLQQKAIRRAQLLGLQPGMPIPMALEQEDINAYNFSVCVTSERGRMKHMNFYMRECKECREVKYYGDLHTITDLFAEASAKQMTAEHMAQPIEEDAEASAPVEEVKEEAAAPQEEHMNNLQSAEDILGPGMFLEDLQEQKEETPTSEN